MWLGSGIAVAVTQAGSCSSLAWEPPYATGAALKSKKKKSLYYKALDQLHFHEGNHTSKKRIFGLVHILPLQNKSS